MAVEFASSPVNCRSTSTKRNTKGHIHSCITATSNSENTTSWLPSSESDNLKTQNNVDSSWLPDYNDNKSFPESDNSNHINAQNDFDDSWLPNYNHTNRNHSETTSEPNNSNHCLKIEDDSDYSWLPSTYHGKKNNDNKSRNQDHWTRAREVVFSGDQQIQHAKLLDKKSNFIRSPRQVSPSKSECSAETPNSGGVSTILRRWKDLDEIRNSNKKTKISSTNTQTNYQNHLSGNMSIENHNLQASSSRSCDAFERCASSSTTEDSFFDWESCTTSPSRPFSCPNSSQGTKAIDVAKEKNRVVEIIKKLSKEEDLAARNGNESPVRICTTSNHQWVEGENKRFSHVIGSPRLIRGRQAFKYFLMLKEQDKQRELGNLSQRKLVSEFSYRGRIQASLHVRLTRVGAEPKIEAISHKHSILKTLEPSQLPIMDLRDRVCKGLEQNTTTSKEKNNKKEVINHGSLKSIDSSPVNEAELNITTNNGPMTTSYKSTQVASLSCYSPVKNATTTTQESKIMATSSQSTQEADDHHQILELTSPHKEVVDKSKDIYRSSPSMPSKEDTHSDIRTPNRKDSHDEGWFIPMKMPSSGIDEKMCNDVIQVLNDMGDPISSSNRQSLENYHDLASEYSQPRSNWDEEEEDYDDMHNFQTDLDWIRDIARPRSDWEGLRQTRYQEMLNSYSYNGDIRELLERRSVSNFLSSCLRDKIDQLMVSRTQGCSYPDMCIKDKKQVINIKDGGESRKEEKKEDDYVVNKEKEDGIKIERQCSEYNEFINQNTCSSMPAQSPALEERSWSHPNTSYDSDQMESPSTSPFVWNNNAPQSYSFMNHPSMEMEIIYDLRGHMEQLHQEMMELRKSIQNVAYMQVQMERSINQNVVAVVAQAVQKKINNCCLCCTTQVDSFLYRCGHMCTCFDCSLELQCTNGKCPICEAPILDVVRAHGLW